MPCRRLIPDGSTYCSDCDPDNFVADTLKGGKTGQPKSYWKNLVTRVHSMEDVRELILIVISDVKMKKIDSTHARTIQLFLPTLVKTIEVGDVEKRLRFVEELLRKRNTDASTGQQQAAFAG